MSYDPAGKLVRDVDIAPDLKRIITILLLLIMTGQVTGSLYSTSTGAGIMQYIDDNNDSETKKHKKEGKEFVSPSLGLRNKPINKGDFNLAAIIIVVSPVIDHITPPPDGPLDY